MKKHVHVAAALIFENGKIFATRRGDSPYPYVAHKLEFPGGKIEPNETGEEAVKRELLEELDMEVTVGDCLEKPPSNILILSSRFPYTNAFPIRLLRSKSTNPTCGFRRQSWILTILRLQIFSFWKILNGCLEHKK